MSSLTILDTIRLVHPAREMAELIVSLEKIQHGHLKKKKNNMEICFMLVRHSMFWIYLRMIIKYCKYKSYGTGLPNPSLSFCQLQSPLLEVPQLSASEEHGHWGWCFHCRSLKWTVVKPHKKVLVPPNLNQITAKNWRITGPIKIVRGEQLHSCWEPHVISGMHLWKLPFLNADSSTKLATQSRSAHWAGPTMLQVDSPSEGFGGSHGGNGSTHGLLIIGVTAGTAAAAAPASALVLPPIWRAALAPRCVAWSSWSWVLNGAEFSGWNGGFKMGQWGWKCGNIVAFEELKCGLHWLTTDDGGII